jgi:hypothetical protein
VLLILLMGSSSAQTAADSLRRADSLRYEKLIAGSYPDRSFASNARLMLSGKLKAEDAVGAHRLIEFMDHRLSFDGQWLTASERLLAETILADTILVADSDHIATLLAGSQRLKGDPTIDDQLLQREHELLRGDAERITSRFDEHGRSQQERRFFNLLLNHLLVKGYRARAALNELVERFALEYASSWRAEVARSYFIRPYDEADFGAAFSVAYAAGRFDGSLGRLFDAFYGPVLGGEFYLYGGTIAGSLTIGVATAPASFRAGNDIWSAGKSSFLNGSLGAGYELRLGRLAITPTIGLALQSARGPGEESEPDTLPRTGNRLGLDAAILIGYRIPFDIGPSIDLRIRLGRTSTTIGDYDPQFNGGLYSVQIGLALVQRPYRSGL